MLTVLDLFSGIGGFSLGLERTGGFTTLAFCEFADYPRRVLAERWPGVPCFPDVRLLSGDLFNLAGPVDVICGGFPCQDISLAGKGAGLTGERSGLWFAYLRLIEEVRPRWVIIENVSALRSRGLDEVLRGLAALGFDAEWHCIPAAAVGAPHRRDRVWIVAHARGEGRRQELRGAHGHEGADAGRSSEDLHVAGRDGAEWDVADTYLNPRHERRAGPIAASYLRRRADTARWWAAEPDVGRVAHGVPARVDRLKALGNAVVPQIPEIIGHAILAAEGLA